MAQFNQNQLKALSLFSLEKYLEEARGALNTVDSSDTTALKAAVQKFELFDTEMGRRQSSSAAPGLNSTFITADKPSNNIEWRNMNDDLKDSVALFQPGREVTKFIHDLDNVYRTNVTSENGLEKYFCRAIPKRICQEYRTNFLTLPQADQENFAKIKEHLLKTYQTQETIYQTMSKVWDFQQGPGEDICTLGIRMEEKCLEIFEQIKTKFLQEQNVKSNGKTEFDAKDAFLLMGSMLMVQHVRTKEPVAYNLMVRDIDDAFTPAEIGNRAKTYTDRIGKSEPAAVNNGTFHSNKPSSQPKKPKNEMDCNHWKKWGSCKFKNPKDGKKPCPYRHLDKYKKDQKPKSQKAMHASGNTGTIQHQNTPAPTPTQPGPPPPTPHPYYTMPQYYHPNMAHGPPQANPSFNFANARKQIEDIGYENMGQEVFHQS